LALRADIDVDDAITIAANAANPRRGLGRSNDGDIRNTRNTYVSGEAMTMH
jgi:hypothetical protein